MIILTPFHDYELNNYFNQRYDYYNYPTIKIDNINITFVWN